MQTVSLQSSGLSLIDSISLPFVEDSCWNLTNVVASGEFDESSWLVQTTKEQCRQAFVGQCFIPSFSSSMLSQVLASLTHESSRFTQDISWVEITSSVWEGTTEGCDARVCVAVIGDEFVVVLGMEFVSNDEWNAVSSAFIKYISPESPQPYFYFAVGVNARSAMSTVLLPRGSGRKGCCWALVSSSGTSVHNVCIADSVGAKAMLSLKEHTPTEPTARIKEWLKMPSENSDDFLSFHDKVRQGIYLEHPRLGAKQGLVVDCTQYPTDVFIRPLYSRTTKKRLLAQATLQQRSRQERASPSPSLNSSEPIETCIWLARSQELEIPISESLEITPSVLYPLQLHKSVTSHLTVSRRSALNVSDSVFLVASSRRVKYQRLREARSAVEFIEHLIFSNVTIGSLTVKVKSPGRLILAHPTKDIQFHWWVRPSGCQNAGVIEVVSAVVRLPKDLDLIEEIVSQLLE